jgi:rsbT co-antagonist protein RsbR
MAAFLMWVLWQFSARLRATLAEAWHANTNLQEIRASLEEQVAGRTAALQAAFDEAEAARTQLAEQLALIEQQREVIREMGVPVLPISRNTLVMPLVGALDSTRLVQIQEQALRRLEATRARRLLLDITGVPVVDTQVAQGLLRVAQAAKLLGSEVTLIGIRPEVAQTIVGLGLDLSSVHTHSDLQGALGHLGGNQ